MQNDARTRAGARHETGTKVVWDHYRAEIERKLAGNPALLAKCLESYAINKDLSDVAFQYSRAAPSAVDQYVLAGMCAGINAGTLAALVVPVSGEPQPDADAAGNSAILETLPRPFRATFDTSISAGGVNGDGLLWWDDPVKFSFAGESVVVEPQALILEVGLVDSCKVARCIHPERGIGVARWPYGSSVIWLLLPKCAAPYSRDYSGLGTLSYQDVSETNAIHDNLRPPRPEKKYLATVKPGFTYVRIGGKYVERITAPEGSAEFDQQYQAILEREGVSNDAPTLPPYTPKAGITPSAIPSRKVLRELLDLDRATGLLTWRTAKPKHFTADARFSAEARCNMWNGRMAGKPAFRRINGRGYCIGSIFGKPYLAHRVIWKWLHDTDPQTVDHIDGDTKNNRPGNLRAATPQDQSKNTCIPKGNTSGVIGVTRTHYGRWKAVIGHNGGHIYLGCYKTIEEAARARKEAEQRLGYHENHGRAPMTPTPQDRRPSDD